MAKHRLKWLLGPSLALLGGTGGCAASDLAPDLAATSTDMAVLTGAPDMAGPVGPDLGCYDSPTTYLEIINACSSAQSLDKTPVLPQLKKDGSLPPLP